MGDFYIMPSSDKLVFTPIKPDEGVFKIIEETSLSIFQNLKHTPIVAIGTNFTFQLDKSEKLDPLGDYGVTDLLEKYSSLGLTYQNEASLKHVVVNDADKYKLNISYDLSEDNQSLALNYHYDVNLIQDDIEFALKQYVNNYRHALEVSKLLIS